MIAAALSLLALTGAPLPAAEPSPPGTRPSAATAAQDPLPETPAERLSAWPELADAAAAKRELARLRKAATEAMEAESRAALVALGAAAAPLLLDALGKERDTDARDRIAAVLEEVTGAGHTRLLAREWAHKSEAVRHFALARTAAFPDPGLTVTARTHFLGLLKRAEGPSEGRPSEAELDLAARAALAAGALEGLERALALAERDWRRSGGALRTSAAGVKGPAATALLLEKLAAAGTDGARVAALQLLAVAGTREAVHPVRVHLDAEANAVRVAAINALRGIVDGAPPLDNLSVFTAIEEAKRWKERT